MRYYMDGDDLRRMHEQYDEQIAVYRDDIERLAKSMATVMGNLFSIRYELEEALKFPTIKSKEN